MKAILQLLLCLFPCILAGVPPYYYYNQPPQDAYYQYAPVVAQAPQGAFQYTNFHNGSASYSPPEIRTECQAGSYCTVDMFCDVNVTISSVPLNLTEEEKDDRGELIPCWHVETQEIQVCCNPPSDEPKENVKSEDLKDFATCPRVPRAFSESSCSDVASTCASVGKPDQSCLNNELCCYDGCANRCISDLSPEPVEETSPSEAVSNFLSGSNSHSYSALPYRHSYYHPTPYAAPSYHHSASYAPRPFKAIFPQSPSYSIRTSGSVSSSTPKPNSVEVALPSYPTTQSPPSPAYPRYPSYSQSTIYKPEKTGSPYSSYSHSYSNSQSFGYSRPASTAAHTHEALTQAEAYHSPSPATQASPYHSPTPVPQEHPYTPQQQSSPYSYRTPQNSYYEASQPTAYEPAPPSKPVQYSGYELRGASHDLCPSALSCVPKKNCDFNGVIVSHVVSTSPEFDTVRVPLLPCIHPQTGSSNVCCRDPNYVDPYSQY